MIPKNSAPAHALPMLFALLALSTLHRYLPCPFSSVWRDKIKKCLIRLCRADGKLLFFYFSLSHDYFSSSYTHTNFPISCIYTAFKSLKMREHAPTKKWHTDTHCRNHTKTVSHLIWGFVCLNKISLALSIPFLFPTCQCSGDWTSMPIDQSYLKQPFNSPISGQLFFTVTANKRGTFLSKVWWSSILCNTISSDFFSRLIVLLALVYSNKDV